MPRAHDPLGVDGRERRVALELAEEAGQDTAEERIGEDVRELVQALEQERAHVTFLLDVELGGELADRVGDQVLLRRPAPVDRVLADARAGRDRLHRGLLEAALGEQL